MPRRGPPSSASCGATCTQARNSGSRSAIRSRHMATRSAPLFSPDSSQSIYCLSMPICDLLSHMKSLSCLVISAVLPVCAQVKVSQHTDRISIDIDGKPFTEMFIGAETTKPYLHPLRAASGKIVTRAYPMDIVEGEGK